MKKILLLIISVITFTKSYCSTFIDDDYSGFNIGETIVSPTNSYTILNELGAGAFGRVYEVEDSEGQKFALKSYKSDEKGFSFSLYEDCDREFSRGQVLDHPHIIKSFEVFSNISDSNQQTDNLILQLVQGKTVHSTAKGILSKEEGVQAALQIYDALHYAFTCEYLHLDLHEGNVMLSDQEGLMIIDLASFFSFEELFNFVNQSTSLSSSSKTLQTLTNRGALALNLNALTLDEKSKKEPKKIRNGKVKQFFLNHPALFDHLKQMMAAEKKSCSVPLLAEIAEQKSTNNKNKLIHAGFCSYYFELITKMCIKILEKATIARDERINMRVEINKLVWNYQEDLEEGKIISFNEYLDQLSQVLNTI